MAKKIRLDERTKNILIAAALALAAIVISYSIVKFHNTKINQLNSDIVDEKKKLALRKETVKVEEVIKGYNKYFYNKSEANRLRDIVSGLAKNSGVNIISTQPLESERLGNYIKVSLRIRTNCTYNQLGRFIEAVENLPQLTKIGEISLSVARESYDVSDRDEQAILEKETNTETALSISAYCLD